MTNNNNIIFREVQQFRQKWLWIILIFAILVSWYAFIQKLTCNKTCGSCPISCLPVILPLILVGLLLPLGFYFCKLITEVRNDGIYIRFIPFHFSFQKISLNDIKNYEARKYRPIREYGGWGIRWMWNKKAYNVSGNLGVDIELKNGKRIMIGSQKPEELKNAIDLVFEKPL